MTPAERVKHLVSSGAIPQAEGDRLLAAMQGEASSKPRGLRLLANPFERFGGGVAASVGLVVAVASLGLTRMPAGIRFDGFLNLHITRHIMPLYVALVEQTVAWIVPALVYYAYARVFVRGVRIVDFLGMTGLARSPVLIYATVLANFPPEPPQMPIRLSGSLLAVAFGAIVTGAVQITLLVMGFKNASGLAGARLIAGFILLLLLTETLSKVFLLIAT